MQQNNQFGIKEYLFDLLCSIGIGLVFMQVIVGLDKLNPTFTSWILIRGSDISYHYLSWEYFKDGPWAWPPGRLEGYAYPMYNSVMYTDSIPLLALFFKIIRFILPNDFQYFGIWYAMCFILNTYFGLKILKHIGWSPIFRILLVPFFTGAVVLLARFGHAALCGQWLILYCLLIYLNRNLWSLQKVKRHSYGVVALASLIHPYLLFMVLGLITAVPMRFKLDHKISWISFGREILIYILISLTGWYLSGAFLFKGQLSEGLGRFSANFNTFINAWDVGRWGPSFEYYGDGQGEGIAYLGLGILILIVLLIFVYLIKNKTELFRFHFHQKPVNTFFFSSILFFVFALSPKWAIGNHLLIDWGYNDYISRTFRGTGRFAWPLFYFILFGAFRQLYLWKASVLIKYAVVIIILVIQGMDLSPIWKRKPYIDDPAFKLTFIDQINHLITKCDKLIFYPPYSSSLADFGDYIYFTDLAQRAQKPITTGYGARFPETIGKMFRDSLHDFSGYLRQYPNDLVITHADSVQLHQRLIREVKGVSFQLDRYRLFVSDSLKTKLDLNVFDPRSMAIISHQTQTALTDFLKNNQHYIILGAVYEEGVSNLKETTKSYLKEINMEVDSLKFGTSWAFILKSGKKFKEAISMKEAVSLNDTLQCRNKNVTMDLLSAGYQAGNKISIKLNGQEYFESRRGLSLLVLDSCGIVLDKVHYDTYSSDRYFERITN